MRDSSKITKEQTVEELVSVRLYTDDTERVMTVLANPPRQSRIDCHRSPFVYASRRSDAATFSLHFSRPERLKRGLLSPPSSRFLDS
jgi:hypothetical protein